MTGRADGRVHVRRTRRFGNLPSVQQTLLSREALEVGDVLRALQAAEVLAVLERLPGRLPTVESGRIRLRPA
jgi:hypothetical protein